MAFPWQVMFCDPPRDQFLFAFDDAVSNLSRWNWVNNFEYDLIIAELYHSWPDGTNFDVVEVAIEATTIWNASDWPSPVNIPADSSWLGPESNRVLAAKSSGDLLFYYASLVAGSGYETIITLKNGWQFGDSG